MQLSSIPASDPSRTFPAGKYWLGSVQWDYRAWRVLGTEHFWMNNETPVGATCTNDGERWCWASVVDSEGTWLSKTEAESTSGIFAETLVTNDVVKTLDGHWQTFDSPFTVEILPGPLGDVRCLLCVKVTSADYEWHVDTTSFIWMVTDKILPDPAGNRPVAGNEEKILEVARKIGICKSINQMKCQQIARAPPAWEDWTEMIQFLESLGDV